jgi:acyl-coenzyme A thioesterase PaaI-like protein
MKTLRPKPDNNCFGCGGGNPMGLQLTFHGEPDKQTAWTEFQPPEFLAGAIDMMHGGFISLLLDEVSSKVLSMQGKRGVTRSLEVSFDKPVPLNEPIRLEAELVLHEGRKHFIDSRICNPRGEVLAQGKALFLVFKS